MISLIFPLIVLQVAIGMTESGMKLTAQSKNGKRFGYKGAFQVIEKEHGKVPKGLFGQLKQNEKILEELLEETNNDPMESLVKYNSYKNRKAGLRYAKKVRKKAFEVSLLEVL